MEALDLIITVTIVSINYSVVLFQWNDFSCMYSYITVLCLLCFDFVVLMHVTICYQYGRPIS